MNKPHRWVNMLVYWGIALMVAIQQHPTEGLLMDGWKALFWVAIVALGMGTLNALQIVAKAVDELRGQQSTQTK